ncbi:hypothetical protein Tco_1087719 [Tanacetum coccineum]
MRKSANKCSMEYCRKREQANRQLCPTPHGSVVWNTLGKGSKQTPDGTPGFMLKEATRSRDLPCREYASARKHASARRTSKDPERRRRKARSLIRSYVTCSSERQREIEKEWNAADQANRRAPTPSREATLSESRNGEGGYWKSMSTKKKSSTNKDDLSQPLLSEETDPFTPRIRNFMFPKRIRMSRYITRQFLPESIDNCMKLWKAFLAYFLQQKKYIKDPVEVHHMKQREGESTEAFMNRFKADNLHVKGAPECLRISCMTS